LNVEYFRINDLTTVSMLRLKERENDILCAEVILMIIVWKFSYFWIFWLYCYWKEG